MTKKVVSFVSTLHKKKPIKRNNKRTRLRTIFRKFFNYMKSDTYMFAPLISPQSSVTFTPDSLGEGFSEPIKKKEKKFVQELDQYSKCDCYMYAPMVLDSAVETTSAPTGVHSQRKECPGVRCNLIGQSSEKTMRDSGNRMDNFREIASDDSCTPTKRIAIKHPLAQKERVKHVVHQNCRPKSIPDCSINVSTMEEEWHFTRNVDMTPSGFRVQCFVSCFWEKGCFRKKHVKSWSSELMHKLIILGAIR